MLINRKLRRQQEGYQALLRGKQEAQAADLARTGSTDDSPQKTKKMTETSVIWKPQKLVKQSPNHYTFRCTFRAVRLLGNMLLHNNASHVGPSSGMYPHYFALFSFSSFPSVYAFPASFPAYHPQIHPPSLSCLPGPSQDEIRFGDHPLGG
jgi:hypothetical protein